MRTAKRNNFHHRPSSMLQPKSWRTVDGSCKQTDLDGVSLYLGEIADDLALRMTARDPVMANPSWTENPPCSP